MAVRQKCSKNTRTMEGRRQRQTHRRAMCPGRRAHGGTCAGANNKFRDRKCGSDLNPSTLGSSGKSRSEGPVRPGAGGWGAVDGGGGHWVGWVGWGEVGWLAGWLSGSRGRGRGGTGDMCTVKHICSKTSGSHGAPCLLVSIPSISQARRLAPLPNFLPEVVN